MTAIQLNAMNTELWQGIGAIADSESLMRRLTKYVKKLAAEKQADPTCLTKEEYLQKIDRSLQQAKRGEVYRMLPDESLDDFLKRVG